MKKIMNMLLLLPLVAMAAVGCSKDPLVFDHEKAQFETNANAVLLEVILPMGSTASDTYYIVGDFNGGEEAIGDATWRLQKAPGNDLKWGIYLVPSYFRDGKTLADGYYFYSVAQREERTVNNKAVMHKLENARLGERYNSWVDRWAAYFDGSGGEEEDFYTIFVENRTTWEDIALYAWYADASVSPAWPGWTPTGIKTVNGIELVYWEMKGYNDNFMHLIFNDNGGASQVDGPQNFELNRDLYITLTDSGYEEFDIENPYKGYVIYVEDQTGWPITNAYAWRTEVTGPGWPGWEVAGTKTVNGTDYLFFRPGEGFSNSSMRLLFNDGADRETNSIGFTLDQDRYFKATADNNVVEVDPFGSTYKMYVENRSDWTSIGLYYWGTGIDDTPWPGLSPVGTEEHNGVTYSVFELPSALDTKETTFILNNGGNVQLAGATVTVSGNLYYRIPASPVHETTAPEEIKFRIYVDDQSGWAALALYGWGDFELGGWPGLQPAGTEVINTVTYTYFDLPTGAIGKGINLIFNNNAGGSQFDGPYVTVWSDFYYSITSSAATVVTP